MKIYKKIKNKKGSSIAYALVVIVSLSILLTSAITFVTAQLKAGYYSESKQKAFEIAEAGVFWYRWYLAHQTDGRTAQQIDAFWQAGTAIGISPQTFIYKDPWGENIGEYKISVTAPVVGSTIALVVVEGWTYKYPNSKRKISVRFRRPSWSENIVLADDNIRFGDGTTIAGKIHSNKGIRFDGLATGLITSSLNTYDDPDHVGGNEIGVHTHKLLNGTVNDTYRVAETNPVITTTEPPFFRTDVFQAGRRVNVPEIPFANAVSDLGFMRTEATVKYDNSGKGRKITLKTNGDFDMCKVNSYSVPPAVNCGSSISLPGDSSNATNQIIDYNGIVNGASNGTNGNPCITTACCKGTACSNIGGNANKGKCISLTSATIPNNGIIFVANNVWIDGQIDNKKITIVAAELADEPGYTGGAKNIFIGTNNLTYLNHNKNTVIGLFAQNNILTVRDSQNNLEIDAALLAKNGKVGRCYYNGLTRNTITVNGAIATKLRYGFLYGTDAGYLTRNLTFDDNLLYYPPPYFPTGTKYTIDLWEEL